MWQTVFWSVFYKWKNDEEQVIFPKIMKMIEALYRGWTHCSHLNVPQADQ